MGRGSKAASVLLLAAGCCRGGPVQSVPPATAVESTGGQALTGLNFPATAFGATAAQTFQVVSQSTVDAHVSVAISGPKAALFTVSPAAESPVDIPSGGAQLFTVTYAPLLPNPIPPGDEIDTATITVTSDDPQHPSTLVALTGRAAAQRLDLCWADTPTSQQCLSDGGVTVQFGTVAFQGQSQPQEIDVVNRSDVPLQIASLALDGAALDAGFQIVEHVATPFPLSATSGESEVLHLLLVPRQSGALAGTFEVTADDPRLGGKPAVLALAGNGQPPGQPSACLGIDAITYADGHEIVPPQIDPAQSLSAQPGVVPPGPLDTATFTAETQTGCSSDPQDGTNLHFQFALAGPPGSRAALAPVSGHPEEQKLTFDVAGLYTVTVSFTDSAGLTAQASVTVDAVPHDDLSFEVSWQSPAPVDLDLHLVRVPDAGPGSDPRPLAGSPSADCYYCNCLPAADEASGAFPCVGYPSFVDWGAPDDAGVRDFDDPLLAAQFEYAPLRSEPLDIANLSHPEPGADYDVLVHYFVANAVGGPCGTDTDCDADAGYAVCQSGECLPVATAQLRTFVEGAELDAGAPVALEIPQTCDLWWAGTLHWIASSVPLPDGGALPPQFTFTPHRAADGGYLTIAGSLGPAGCPLTP